MGAELRVILVEDSQEDAELLLHELARGGYALTHVHVRTLEALREALSNGPWDLVLSDFSLKTFDALDVLKAIRDDGRDLPCITISGTIDEDMAVESLRSGANDFIVKNRLARLLPAITRELREAEERRKRRHAEKALAEASARYQFALEAAEVGIWEVDHVSGAASWSEVCERLHGLAPGSFAGTYQAFLDAVHPDDRRRIEHLLEAKGAHGDHRLEYRITLPEGSVRSLAGVGRTFFDAAGNAQRSAGIAIDVTAQKRLEEQFRQSQKMESIGNLAGGVAHDFNNLLSIITGYCELLMERLADDPDSLSELDEIRAASTRAVALTRQLLAFSRKQILAPQVVNLNQLIARFEGLLRRLIEENVAISLRLDDDVRNVYVDPGQMEQVLLNLAVNARDAMPDGGALTIETSNVELGESYVVMHPDVQAGRYVAWTITDNGTGMSRDVLSHAFEPFFTTKEKGRGTGLGLSTVHGIVRQSGGHISVYSEPGLGTTFKIFLPVADSGPPEPVVGTCVTPAGLSAGETVLVVEDDPRLRALDERILRRYGYQVLSAGDSVEARAVVASHEGPIHLALIDVIMPGVSGKGVGDWIKLHRPGTEILYMSGYTDTAIVQHGILDPGTEFIQKPFTPEALARKLQQLLRGPDSGSIG